MLSVDGMLSVDRMLSVDGTLSLAVPMVTVLLTHTDFFFLPPKPTYDLELATESPDSSYWFLHQIRMRDGT